MSSAAVAWSEASYDWEREWERRLSLATPEDTARGLFCQGTLAAVRALGDEEVVRRCLAACGGQEQYVEFFNYPVSLNLRLVSTAMSLLASRYGGSEWALWRLGQRTAMDFLESTAGRTLLRLVREEPRRLVSHLPSAYRVSVCFGERAVTWTGPRSCRLTMQRDFLPVPFHEGVLVAMLERLDAQGVKVDGRQTGVLDSEYDISWQ